MYGLNPGLVAAVVVLCVTSLEGHNRTSQQKVADWFANADVGFSYIASNLNALKAGMAAQKADINKLDESLKKMGSHHATISNKLSNTATTVKSLKAGASNHAQRITNVENALAQYTQSVSGLTNSVTSLSYSVAQLKNKVNDIAAKQPSCRAGWTQRKNICYKYNQCTQDSECTSDKVEMACARQQATLAIIRSEEDNTFVSGIGGSNPTHRLLIGARDKRTEMTFMWPDGSPVTYTNWYTPTGEPNNLGEEDCVLLYRDGGYNNRWNDGKCDKQYTSHDTGYVCQMPVGTVTA